MVDRTFFGEAAALHQLFDVGQYAQAGTFDGLLLGGERQGQLRITQGRCLALGGCRYRQAGQQLAGSGGTDEVLCCGRQADEGELAATSPALAFTASPAFMFGTQAKPLNGGGQAR